MISCPDRGSLPNPGGRCGIGGTNVKLGDPSEWAACQAGLVPTEE
ncbi:hypothetical protein ABT352_04100 [Streptosporangium sp. NPDC000563]